MKSWCEWNYLFIYYICYRNKEFSERGNKVRGWCRGELFKLRIE